MGLISWIKTKYYNHKLNRADKITSQGDYDKARIIYESILGKQPLAGAHLAKMLVASASDIKDKVDAFNYILQIRQYCADEAEQEYNATVDGFVRSIEATATKCFDSKSYSDAVELLETIKEFNQTTKFKDKLLLYQAYKSFNAAQNAPYNVSRLFDDTIKYVKASSSLPVTAIKDWIKVLESQNRYYRAIQLLSNLVDVGSWIMTSICKFAIEVIEGNDSEVKTIKAISNLCSSNEICEQIAKDIWKRANQKANNKDYKKAVKFDTFAVPYLSSDNKFNNDRCNHILEELAERASSKEIQALKQLCIDLKLSDSQIRLIDRRIFEIAKNTTPQKSIEICRLFINDATFNTLYIDKAVDVLNAKGTVNIKELRDVISHVTDEKTLPDVLSKFVNYISAYDDDFFKYAISRIKDEKSIQLLDKYWSVKKNQIFISSLVNKDFDSAYDFSKHIAKNHNRFLVSDRYTDLFCTCVKGLGNVEFSFSILESLIAQDVNVKSFYVGVILVEANNISDVDASLSVINRGLSHICDSKLLTAKKSAIAKLISSGNFDKAEEELRSILSIEAEAPTLLLELYLLLSKKAAQAKEKYNLLFKALEVSESYSLVNHGENLIQEVLASLVQISQSLHIDSKSEESYIIANRIKAYPKYWIPLYIWLKNRDKGDTQTLNQSIKYDFDTISNIESNCSNCRDFYSDEYSNLWVRYIENVVKKAQSQPKDKAIINLNDLRNLIKECCPEPLASSKYEEVTNIYIKIKWSLAIELEQEEQFEESIKLYNEICTDSVSAFINRAELRSLICHVKAGQISENISEKIETALTYKSYQSLREDLAFRYSVYLIKTTQPAKAEQIILKYLPDEKTLLDICENAYIKEAELKLEEFNNLVTKLNDNKMSLADALTLKSQIQDYKKQISFKLTDLSRSFGQFTPKIEAYILRKMFEEEAYMELLNKLMQENPNYIEDDIDFRNIAIASLGIIDSDIKDEPTLKRAIATCLTAIYSDRLFVQSLDYTSWDDKFTFTLNGSLGATGEIDYDDLPQNVNFDEPVENVNIAIRDVQNSLLTRVETAVRNKHPKLEDFCNAEKDALDKIINLNLDKEYILASPHLCRTLSSLRMSIGNAFEYELSQNYGNRDEVIALGVDYGFTDGEYGKYKTALNLLAECKKAIKGDVYGIRNTFVVTTINAIKQYSQLFSDLKSAIGTSMNEEIKADFDFKKFLDKYEIVCKVLNDTTISLTCSNYVNGKVVHLLNQDTMELRDGVSYMVRIFNISPSNIQVKQNLEGILRNLVLKVEDEGLTSDKNALNKALVDTGSNFRSMVEDAQIQAKLSVIIDKVNSGKMRKYTALSETYNLYVNATGNERICENLVTLCEMCIFEYIIKDAYNQSSVKKVLDALQNNMSPTFKRKARKLAQTYQEIWSQLPMDTKMLMNGLGGYNTTLNDKGYALKRGIEYLKRLGSVQRSGSLFD